VHPRRRKKSIFEEIFAGRGGTGLDGGSGEFSSLSIACVLYQVLRKKVHPRQNPGYAQGQYE